MLLSSQASGEKVSCMETKITHSLVGLEWDSLMREAEAWGKRLLVIRGSFVPKRLLRGRALGIIRFLGRGMTSLLHLSLFKAPR